jgi:hypothetical protein
MHRPFIVFAALFLGTIASCHATTLPPELKAYDFARAYYVEDGGVVIVPQEGFYCSGGVQTPEGIRLKPGQVFIQFDESRLIMEVYKFISLDAGERRAHFHEARYHYKVTKDAHGKRHVIPQEYIDSTDFYLSHFRLLEWFDFAFPYIEIHPGEQNWRTRPWPLVLGLELEPKRHLWQL